MVRRVGAAALAVTLLAGVAAPGVATADSSVVSLDSPVADYLPQYGLDRRITVRMLLQHTSGVFNYTGEYYENGTVVPGIPVVGKEWVDNRFHTYQPEELVRLALSKPPRFAPGTGWSYSNTNYTLARLLIEKVTGRSYAKEMQRRILRHPPEPLHAARRR